MSDFEPETLSYETVIYLALPIYETSIKHISNPQTFITGPNFENLWSISACASVNLGHLSFFRALIRHLVSYIGHLTVL